MKPNTYPTASVQKREMDPSAARAAAEGALAAPSTKTVEWNNGINASLTEHTHTVLVTEPGARIPAELFTGSTLLVRTQNGERMAIERRTFNGRNSGCQCFCATQSGSSYLSNHRLREKPIY